MASPSGHPMGCDHLMSVWMQCGRASMTLDTGARDKGADDAGACPAEGSDKPDSSNGGSDASPCKYMSDAKRAAVTTA